MNTENNNTIALEEMKLQLQILQNRLDNEVEIKDKQLRRAIHSRMSSIVRRELAGLLFCIIITPGLTYYIHLLQQPLWMVIFTFCFMLICIAFQGYEYAFISSTERMMGKNLLEIQKRLLAYKRMELRYLTYCAPVLVLSFLGVFLYSLYNNPLFGNYDGPFVPLIIGAFVGGCLGGVIGYFTFVRPQFRKIDEITTSIADLEV